MQRFLTAAIGVPIAVAAAFLLPPPVFFVLIVGTVAWGAWELVQLLAPAAPGAPLWLLLVWAPALAVLFYWSFEPAVEPALETVLLVVGLSGTVVVGSLVLLARTPPGDAPTAIGVLGFGVPYFALPAASTATLQRVDPWLVILLCAIVWLGDSAAYYVGSTVGRHKMAPIVSPNKSWEGAAAGLVVAVASAAAWGALWLDEVGLPLLAVAAATAVAAQLGDLFESLLKRGVGVKDSGAVLPGHGGLLDRMDAMLFAAPVLLGGLWLAGIGGIEL